MNGFTCESWHTYIERESGGFTLRGDLGARGFCLCVCGPFTDQGDKGEEEYP
jgi:hypothetical protein